MRLDDYDPTEYGSPEEYAQAQFEAEREFGVPDGPHTGRYGGLVNKRHYDADRRTNDEWGWHGTTDESLRRRWNQ